MYIDSPDRLLPLPGRVMMKRSSGAKLLFYDVSGEGAKIQVMADLRCALCPVNERTIQNWPPLLGREGTAIGLRCTLSSTCSG